MKFSRQTLTWQNTKTTKRIQYLPDVKVYDMVVERGGIKLQHSVKSVQ